MVHGREQHRDRPGRECWRLTTLYGRFQGGLVFSSSPVLRERAGNVLAAGTESMGSSKVVVVARREENVIREATAKIKTKLSREAAPDGRARAGSREKAVERASELRFVCEALFGPHNSLAKTAKTSRYSGREKNSALRHPLPSAHLRPEPPISPGKTSQKRGFLDIFSGRSGRSQLTLDLSPLCQAHRRIGGGASAQCRREEIHKRHGVCIATYSIRAHSTAHIKHRHREAVNLWTWWRRKRSVQIERV